MMKNIKRIKYYKDTLLGKEITCVDNEVDKYDENSEKLVMDARCGMEYIGMGRALLVCEFNDNEIDDNTGYSFSYDCKSNILYFNFCRNTLDITSTKDSIDNAMEMMGLMSNAIIKDCFDKINELRKEISRKEIGE